MGTEAEQEAFNSGDAIAVTANGQAAVTYTFDGTNTWTPEAGKYLKWVDNSMTFNAWYPVTQGTDATTFTVPISYADVDAMAAADYMVYTGTQNKTSGNGVTLPMVRKMARIVITPEMNDQFAEGYSITGIKVHANTIGYASGTVQAGDSEVTAFEQNDVYYALLAPTTADANATFLTVTVAKTNGTNSKNLTVKGIPATEAGKSYDYTLTVGKDKATIGNVTVADWGTSQTIPGGEAEEVPVICQLPIGNSFNLALKNTANFANATSIIFDAKSNRTGGMQIGETQAYTIVEENILYVYTAADVFMFNQTCSYMFSELSGISEIDFGESINTSNVTSMEAMFIRCSSLASLDLSNFNTSNVTSMGDMFYGCSSLESLDLRNFNTSNVTSMGFMFYGCSSLAPLDLSNFNTSNVTGMRYMFSNCSSLASLDLSNFDTSNVTTMSYMFFKCKKLETLDLRSFTLDNIDDLSGTSNMFDGVGSELTSGKTQIYVATSNPFEGKETDINDEYAVYVPDTPQ